MMGFLESLFGPGGIDLTVLGVIPLLVGALIVLEFFANAFVAIATILPLLF